MGCHSKDTTDDIINSFAKYTNTKCIYICKKKKTMYAVKFIFSNSISDTKNES